MTRGGEAGAWLNLFSFYENWIEFLCENFAAIPKLFNEINFCLIFKLRIKYIPVLEYFQTSFMKNISDLLPRYGEQWILSNQTWSMLKLKQSEQVRSHVAEKVIFKDVASKNLWFKESFIVIL